MDYLSFAVGGTILLSGAFCAFRSPEFALRCLPAVAVFFGTEALIWDFLTPNHYPGDFMDMFLPLVTIPIGIVLSLFTLCVTVGIARLSFRIAKKYHGPPTTSFFTGKGDGQTLRHAFDNLTTLCEQQYSREIDALLASGETERTAVFISAMEGACRACAKAREDFVSSRKKDGKIVGLETLLAANVLDSSDQLENFAAYLLKNGNHEDLMRIFSHYYPLALAEGDSQDNARGRLVKFFLTGVDMEILARIGKQTENDPRQYLSDVDFETVCYHLLHKGAFSLDAAFLNAAIEAGFTKDNTRDGSTLFSFVEHYGGPAVIKALLDAGVDPNIVNSSGKTALTCLLQAGKSHSGQYTSDQYARIEAVMDILLPLAQPVLYRTAEDDTLLHMACAKGFFSEGGIDETRLLLAAGAKPGMAGPGPASALDVAREQGLDALLLMLEKEAKQ